MERKGISTGLKNNPTRGTYCSTGDPVKTTRDPKARKKGRRTVIGKGGSNRGTKTQSPA